MTIELKRGYFRDGFNAVLEWAFSLCEFSLLVSTGNFQG